MYRPVQKVRERDYLILLVSLFVFLLLRGEFFMTCNGAVASEGDGFYQVLIRIQPCWIVLYNYVLRLSIKVSVELLEIIHSFL